MAAATESTAQQLSFEDEVQLVAQSVAELRAPWRVWLLTHRVTVVWLFIFVASNVAIIVERAYVYDRKWGLKVVLGNGAMITRAAAQIMAFNLSFILLTRCKLCAVNCSPSTHCQSTCMLCCSTHMALPFVTQHRPGCVAHLQRASSPWTTCTSSMPCLA